MLPLLTMCLKSDLLSPICLWKFHVFSDPTFHSMEEAKKNMYAFSTTTYTGFQCTVSQETSEKFKGQYTFLWKAFQFSFFSASFLKFVCVFYIGLPGVMWVLPDSYLDVKNKDYGG